MVSLLLVIHLNIFSNFAAKYQEMLVITILCAAIALVVTAADTNLLTEGASYSDAAALISAINAYPYLKTYYTEVFGGNWRETISDAYADGRYTKFLTDWADYSDYYNGYHSEYSYFSKYYTQSFLSAAGSQIDTTFSDYAAFVSYMGYSDSLAFEYSYSFDTQSYNSVLFSVYGTWFKGYYSEDSFDTESYLSYVGSHYSTSFADYSDFLAYNGYYSDYHDEESFLSHQGSLYSTSFADYSDYKSFDYSRTFDTSSYYSFLSSVYGTDLAGYSSAISEFESPGVYETDKVATSAAGGTGSNSIAASTTSRNSRTNSAAQSGSTTDSSEESAPSIASSGGSESSGSASGGSASGGSASGSSTSGNSGSSTSSTAGVYSVGVPFVGLFAALIAVL
ncbi:hypothetical protein CLIB1423_33S00562 [[Candida] railenensis]|uniref:Uncharacterized protein n=1 Tax=[Candida] railenensis TaxID=45579 RepID=A0A9P0QWC8_9ASCO|nr:hypothetical protein CLIB1423_33S00562 [[Candida] railenensis]